jgi:hypothetical protein
MNRLIAVAIAALALAVATSAAFAVQFRENRNPALTDLGLSLQARRVIEDLAPGQSIAVHLNATAQVVAQCVNPNNDHAKPTTSEPEAIAVQGFQRIPRAYISDKNRAQMNVITQPPALIVDGNPDCKGGDTEEIIDLRFSAARFLVEQPPGTQVLAVNCTIAPPSANGLIPPGNVVCVKE